MGSSVKVVNVIIKLNTKFWVKTMQNYGAITNSIWLVEHLSLPRVHFWGMAKPKVS